MAAKPAPFEITRANQWDVRIRWSDGHEAVYPAGYLRRYCCCAVCLEEGGADALPPDVHPLEIRAIGNYAIQLAWSDGHTTGVYPFQYLRGLCPCPSCRGAAASRPR